jgi:hypothetical protein
MSDFAANIIAVVVVLGFYALLIALGSDEETEE